MRSLDIYQAIFLELKFQKFFWTGNQGGKNQNGIIKQGKKKEDKKR